MVLIDFQSLDLALQQSCITLIIYSRPKGVMKTIYYEGLVVLYFLNAATLLADLFVICTIFPFFSALWAAVDGGILPHTYASILCLICASRSFFLQEISTLHTACRKTNKPYLFFYVYLPLLKRLTKESDSFYEPFKQVFFWQMPLNHYLLKV